MDDRVVTSASPAAPGVERVGGKAAALFFLARSGFPVPPFFCVEAGAFRRFVSPARSALRRACARALAGSREALLGAGRDAEEALAGLSMDEALARTIHEHAERIAGPGGMCAVRSSALGEDSAERSFAGIFSSFLFVPPAEAASFVRACWRAAFSPGMLAYCLRQGQDPAELRLAVIVQRMVRARASGVLFTTHPAGPAGRMVITAGYGLGEGVVTDRVETDRYVIDRLNGTFRSEVAAKTGRVEFDEAAGRGTRLRPVDADLAARPVLDEPSLRRLARLGRAVEQAFGRPQDLEWCLGPDGEIHLLQSRPVTGPAAGPVTIYDNSNIVESFPGVTLPLTFSIVREGYGRNFRRMVRRVGVPESEVERNRPVFDHLVGSIQGRVYYNLTNWYAMLDLVPGLGRRLTPAFEDMVGIKQRGEAGTAGARDAVRRTGRLAAVAFHLTRHFFGMDRRMRAYGRTIDRWWSRERSRDLARMSARDLVRHLRYLDLDVVHVIHVPLLANLLLMVAVAAAKRVLALCGAADPDGAFNALLCGTGTLASTLPLRSMLDLADRVRRDPGRRQALEEALDSGTGPDSLESFLDDPGHASFAAAFRDHLDRYGDRFPEELKLEREGFRERPDTLLRALLRQVASGLGAEQLQARERRVRSAAETDAAALVRGRPIRRALLKTCLARARRFVAYRERARLDRARGAGICRSLAREIGSRLAGEGSLERPEDVFYLTVQELDEYVHGSGVSPPLRDLVRERRERYEACRGFANPPERVVCHGTAGRSLLAQDPAAGARVEGGPDEGEPLPAAAAPHGGTPSVRDPEPFTASLAGPAAPSCEVLQGTPCCPGTVEAEAVVVTDPAEAQDVSGRVIVARATDPAWVFLMVAAAGLVMEKGSILSHTAIVGRELGIPTVVGVEGATRKIQTGRRVRLDGAAGTIHLLPRERSPSGAGRAS